MIGILGKQGVGKSTILNALIQSFVVNANGDEKPESKRPVFRETSFEKAAAGEHCTHGIAAWVSPQHRVIFLDTQPIMSPSVLDRHILLDKKYSAPGLGEFNTAENTVELQSLQVAGFLMNVCHILLV